MGDDRSKQLEWSEEGAVSQGMQAPSEAGKGKERDSPLGLQKEAAHTSTLAQ